MPDPKLEIRKDKQSSGMEGLLVPTWEHCCRQISIEEFSPMFHSFEKSAFRLETLPSYAVSHEDSHFQAYVRGDKTPPFIYSDWKATIRNATSAGKTFEIVRLVPEPLTTYFRYELEWHYLEYRDAGQETRFVTAERITESLRSMKGQDFWLLDDKKAVFIKYDNQGDILGFYATEDPNILEKLVLLRSHAKELSIHIDEYLPKYKEQV